jgi:MFS transporter, SP family, sugar:H+ symporter
MLVLFQFWISVGSTIGSVVVNYTETMAGRISYQIPLCLLFIVPVLITIISPFIPDSPRWLLSHGSEDLALAALRTHRGSHYSDMMIAAEFREMKEAWAIEQELARSSSVFDMFRGTDLRRTVLSVLTLTAQGASGSLFLIIYGTYFFLMSGSTQPFHDSIIVSCIGLVSVMLMVGFIRYFRRRIILIVSSGMQAISMLIMAVLYSTAPQSTSALRGLVAFVCVFIFFYTGWFGPTAWVSAGEIPSTRLRSYTLGLGAGVGFFVGWLVSFTAPYFINPADLNWGPKYGYIWFGTNLVNMIFVLIFLPETKDRTLEEIDEMFYNKLPARKFRTYECVGVEQARGRGVEKLEPREAVEEMED